MLFGFQVPLYAELRPLDSCTPVQEFKTSHFRMRNNDKQNHYQNRQWMLVTGDMIKAKQLIGHLVVINNTPRIYVEIGDTSGQLARADVPWLSGMNLYDYYDQRGIQNAVISQWSMIQTSSLSTANMAALQQSTPVRMPDNMITSLRSQMPYSRLYSRCNEILAKRQQQIERLPRAHQDIYIDTIIDKLNNITDVPYINTVDEDARGE